MEFSAGLSGLKEPGQDGEPCSISLIVKWGLCGDSDAAVSWKAVLEYEK